MRSISRREQNKLLVGIFKNQCVLASATHVRILSGKKYRMEINREIDNDRGGRWGNIK